MTAKGVPQGNRLGITVRLRPVLFEKITSAARASGRTVSGEIAWRIEMSIRDEERARAWLAGPTATTKE